MPFDRKSITPEEAWKLNTKERRLLVADLVEYESELAFDMNEWISVDSMTLKPEDVVADPVSCGTSACIAGTVSFFLNPTLTARFATGRATGNSVIADTGEFMDLTGDQRNALFLPYANIERCTHRCSPVDISRIDRKMAASCIRHFAETGEIDWFKAYEDTRK